MALKAALCVILSTIGCGTEWQSRARAKAGNGGDARSERRGGAQSGWEPTYSAYGLAPNIETEEGIIGARDDQPPPEVGAEESDIASRGLETTSGIPTATRYASLDRVTCERELARRKIAFERVDEARGVVAPLRLKGQVQGVDFHSMLPPSKRSTSPYEIYDCRLVLALGDWAEVLTRHDVVEVVHYSVYRPPPKSRTLTGPGRRHGGALAIDAAIFKTRDGRTVSVEKDFHGRIGHKPCGPKAAPTSNLPTEAVLLRQIVCEAADAQLFNVMLTPDYNRPHRNHFHLEVTAGARWVLVR